MRFVGILIERQLYITPVYYLYIERARMWLARTKKAGAPRRAAPGGAFSIRFRRGFGLGT